jgi:hypothetical protein
VWLGRLAITLGIINGGLGFQLAGRMNMCSKPGMIAYGVIAGVIWLAWVAAIVIGEKRKSRSTPPKYTESPRETSQSHPLDGHFAPK